MSAFSSELAGTVGGGWLPESTINTENGRTVFDLRAVPGGVAAIGGQRDTKRTAQS
jgi:hypothetical protein